MPPPLDLGGGGIKFYQLCLYGCPPFGFHLITLVLLKANHLKFFLTHKDRDCKMQVIFNSWDLSNFPFDLLNSTNFSEFCWITYVPDLCTMSGSIKAKKVGHFYFILHFDTFSITEKWHFLRFPFENKSSP